MHSKRMRMFLFGGIACALCLVLVEGLSSYTLFTWDMWHRGGLRIAEARHSRYDPDLGWASIPSQYVRDMYGPNVYLRTNSRGFRSNHETDNAAPAGKYRVVCSGDSMTLGYGVDNDHSWCQLLQASDGRIESVNMGQGGYGADQAYLWYRRDGQQLEHHVQVFAVIGDDFERMQKPQFIGYGRPMLKLAGNDVVPDNVPVPRTSALKRWLALNRPRLEQLRTVQFALRVTGQSGRLWAAQLIRKPPIEATPEKKQIVSKMLESLARINREKGSRLLVVYLPVRSECMQETMPSQPPPGPGPAPAWQAFLRAQTERLGIAYLDLVPEFNKLREDEVDRLYISDRAEIFEALPGHYTEAGNRFVAERILERVRALLPAETAAPVPAGIVTVAQ